MATEQTPARVFKCIPLDPQWTIPGTKLDLKAIYRRPRRRVGEYDEIIQERGEDGLPLYDLTAPLPLRRHSDWSAKGFEYVTVVASPRDVEDPGWGAVAGSLRAKSLNPADYLQHPVFGTWNPKLYMATADVVDRAKLDELTAMVEQFGSAAVLAIKRQNEPTFTLPPALMGIEAGGKVKRVAVPSPGEAVLPRAALAALAAEGGAPASTVVPIATAKRTAAQKGAETKRRNAAAKAAAPKADA